MLLLFVVMNDQPRLTTLEMGVEIIERGDSDIIDLFNKDLAERQAQASFLFISVMTVLFSLTRINSRIQL